MLLEKEFLSDKKPGESSCQTKRCGMGRPRCYEPGTSERVTFRLRRGTWHDEILDVLDTLPRRARSAWITHALSCYVRGEIRDVQRETEELSEQLEMDLFAMFAEDEL